MFMGLTLATIGGVPLATWFGELLGWRTSFWGIAGLGLVAMSALWYALPNVPLPKSDGVMAEIRVLGRGPVLAALALTVVGSSAMFTVFTYIAPILHSEAQASTTFITVMLVLFGIGLTLGNVWGGKAADRCAAGVSAADALVAAHGTGGAGVGCGQFCLGAAAADARDGSGQGRA